MNPELKTVMNKIRMQPSKKYFRGFLLIDLKNMPWA